MAPSQTPHKNDNPQSVFFGSVYYPSQNGLDCVSKMGLRVFVCYCVESLINCESSARCISCFSQFNIVVE